MDEQLIDEPADHGQVEGAESPNTPKKSSKLLLAVLGLIIIALLIFGLVMANYSGLDVEDEDITTPPADDGITYICPETEWVDCMPGPDMPKPWCEPEYLEWAMANCDGFQGAAY